MQRLRPMIKSSFVIHSRSPHGCSLHAEVETKGLSHIHQCYHIPHGCSLHAEVETTYNASPRSENIIDPHGCSLHAEVETTIIVARFCASLISHTGVLCMQRLRQAFQHLVCSTLQPLHGCSLHAEVETYVWQNYRKKKRTAPTRVFSACRTVIGAEDRQMSLVEGGQTEYDISSAFLCVYPPSF